MTIINKKQSEKGSIKISLLPIFILMALVIAIYFLFLSDNELFEFSNSPKLRRLNGFPTTVYTEKDIDKKRLVIENQEQLNEFLNEIDESGYLIVREEINFDKEILIAVSSKTYTTEGYDIKIRKLYQDKDTNTLLVSVREIEPGETCEVEENMTIAVDMVAISKTDLQIDFERVKQVKECN
ncbi:MAG: protease complex subunit PrcB family protein [Paludibacteraceae bacterium]|nr:protease complex subunit PrcB family protein [Paludibacteraceae bacterium]